MDFWVPVHFAGGSLEDFCLDSFRQTQQIDGTVDTGLRRLDGIELVVDRRRRARQIEDFIDFDIEREGNVMAHDFQMRVAHEMFQIILRAGEEVIDDEHVMAVFEHAFGQMGAQEACAAGDENAFANGIVLHNG